MPYPAPFFAALHRGNPGDVAWYRQQCEGAASILELGCGYGRISTQLAEPGRQVVGLERDPGLLALARQAVAALPQARRAGVELVEGDMRHTTLGRRFDRVLLPFGSLYCLLDDDDLDAALANAVAHLAPGGRLVLDVYRADDFHHESEPDDVPDDAHTPVGRVRVEGVAYEVLERSTWDKARQRIEVEYLYVDEAGHTVRGVIEQRYLLEEQLRAAITRAGLQVHARTGAFRPRRTSGHAPREPEDPDDDDDDDALLIVVAARPDDDR